MLQTNQHLPILYPPTYCMNPSISTVYGFNYLPSEFALN